MNVTALTPIIVYDQPLFRLMVLQVPKGSQNCHKLPAKEMASLQEGQARQERLGWRARVLAKSWECQGVQHDAARQKARRCCLEQAGGDHQNQHSLQYHHFFTGLPAARVASVSGRIKPRSIPVASPRTHNFLWEHLGPRRLTPGILAVVLLPSK